MTNNMNNKSFTKKISDNSLRKEINQNFKKSNYNSNTNKGNKFLDTTDDESESKYNNDQGTDQNKNLVPYTDTEKTYYEDRLGHNEKYSINNQTNNLKSKNTLSIKRKYDELKGHFNDPEIKDIENLEKSKSMFKYGCGKNNLSLRSRNARSMTQELLEDTLNKNNIDDIKSNNNNNNMLNISNITYNSNTTKKNSSNSLNSENINSNIKTNEKSINKLSDPKIVFIPENENKGEINDKKIIFMKFLNLN